MKKQKLLNNLKHRLSLLLCLMAFLAVGQSAWATYYLYGGTQQNASQWSNTPLATSETMSFTITASSMLVANTDLYIGVSTASNGYYSNKGNQLIFDNNKQYSGNVSSVDTKDEDNGSGCKLKYLKYRLSANSGAVTVTLQSDGTYNICGADINKYKYILGTSSAPTTTAPTVRIGDKPVETDGFDVNVSAYVAATGCADITKFTVYYSSSTITSTSASGVYSEEFSQSPAPALGSTTTLTLLSNDIAEHDDWKSGGGDMYIRITGTNSAGESVLSDEIKLNYTTCEGIITSLQINPQGKQLAVNTPETFTYTANDGAVVDNVQWYKGGVQVSTDNSYTFTPTTGDQFTIGLKAFNNTCNPTGFDAVTQTYTVCVPIGEVTITNCPTGDVALGQPLTIHASLATGSGDATWVWTVNGAEQEVTVEGLTSSITYTPQSATTYMVIAKAIDCTGAEKTAVCNFVVKKAFTANNLNKTFNACAGGHQFNWADMFTPTPDSWSAVVTTGGADATALFTLKNGIMTWNNEGKTGGDYSYTFTAVKEGYKNATAVLSFSYTAATAPTGTIGEIIVTGSPTYPWTAVNLQCSVNGSDIANVVWSSSNSGLVVSTGIAEGIATAYFKGKVVKKDTFYTITAEGQSETCGSTDPQEVIITVQPEEEEDCELQ